MHQRAQDIKISKCKLIILGTLRITPFAKITLLSPLFVSTHNLTTTEKTRLDAVTHIIFKNTMRTTFYYKNWQKSTPGTSKLKQCSELHYMLIKNCEKNVSTLVVLFCECMYTTQKKL